MKREMVFSSNLWFAWVRSIGYAIRNRYLGDGFDSRYLPTANYL